MITKVAFKIKKNGSSENFGGTSNFRSNVRISGRTFEFPVERSKFKKTEQRKFRWYFEFPSNVRISGRTFEFPVERSKFKQTGHPKISVVHRISRRKFEFRWNVRISGRTFKIQKSGSSENLGGTSEFPVERTNFRSNVRISGRTFEFPVERSKFKRTGHPKISVVL